MTRILLSSVAAAAMLASASGAQAQTEIQWWHAMGGKLGETVNEIAEGFNKTQTDYKIVPVFKGSYTDTMTAVIAAYRAKQAPHIVQVFEVGTANMMAAKGAIYPVYQLMADEKEPFDPKAFIGPIYGYYSTTDGKLLSMPFNSSTPVFYWNKELFQKAGLDPNTPPKTWTEVGDFAKKLVASGAKCGLTAEWQTWILLENYGAWHNLPFATGKRRVTVPEYPHLRLPTQSNAAAFEGGADGAQQHVITEWFDQEFDGSCLHRLDRRGHIGVSADEDDWNVGPFDSDALL